MFDNIPPEVGQTVPGAVGAGVALKFLPGNWAALLFAWVAGAAMAHFVAPALAEWFGVSTPAKLVALKFIVGALGILVLAKAVEVIQAADGREIWSGLKRRFGLEKEGGQS